MQANAHQSIACSGYAATFFSPLRLSLPLLAKYSVARHVLSSVRIATIGHLAPVNALSGHADSLHQAPRSPVFHICLSRDLGQAELLESPIDDGTSRFSSVAVSPMLSRDGVPYRPYLRFSADTQADAAYRRIVEDDCEHCLRLPVAEERLGDELLGVNALIRIGERQKVSLPLPIVGVRQDIVYIGQTKPAQGQTLGLQYGVFFRHEFRFSAG